MRLRALIPALVVAAIALVAAPARALAPGDRLDDAGLVTQSGAPFRFAALHGRSVALAFVYTRCADAGFCPAVAAKFAWLQSRIDPRRAALVLVSLDPAYDTPPVLRAYGRRFAADPARWSLVTGAPARVDGFLRAAGVSARHDPGRVVHDDALVLLDPDGRVAAVVSGTDWPPDGALAALDGAARLRANPLWRVLIGATWSVEHLCGAEPTDAPTSLHHAFVALGLVPPLAALPFLALCARRGRRKVAVRA